MRTHEQRCYEDAYGQRQRDYHLDQALRDCTEAVDHTDFEVTAKMLSDIGNRARWILTSGDLDDKLSFADFVTSNMLNLINRYAEDQAHKDVTHLGLSDTKPW